MEGVLGAWAGATVGSALDPVLALLALVLGLLVRRPLHLASAAVLGLALGVYACWSNGLPVEFFAVAPPVLAVLVLAFAASAAVTLIQRGMTPAARP
jgi:hypothetical protein